MEDYRKETEWGREEDGGRRGGEELGGARGGWEERWLSVEICVGYANFEDVSSAPGR
jgi:hypothetical protein